MFTNLRNDYDTVIIIKTAIAQKWRVQTNFKDKRTLKVKIHFDKLAED